MKWIREPTLAKTIAPTIVPGASTVRQGLLFKLVSMRFLEIAAAHSAAVCAKLADRVDLVDRANWNDQMGAENSEGSE